VQAQTELEALKKVWARRGELSLSEVRTRRERATTVRRAWPVSLAPRPPRGWQPANWTAGGAHVMALCATPT
jgi:hypothetical protein